MDMEQDGTPFPTGLFRSDAFRRKVRVLLDCCSDDPVTAHSALAAAKRMLLAKQLKECKGKSFPGSMVYVDAPKLSAKRAIPVARNGGRRKDEATAEGFA